MLEAAILCMALNVYHEARGEPLEGQIAVIQVTQNRVDDRRYPNNVCDVVYDPDQFTWTSDGLSDKPRDKKAFDRAENLVRWWYDRSIYNYYFEEALRNNHDLFTVIRPTHYHATRVNPRWAKKIHYLGTIGNHKFYREF